MYTVDDEGLEQNGAVLGLADGFVNHAWSSGSPRLGQVVGAREGKAGGGRETGEDLGRHGGETKAKASEGGSQPLYHADARRRDSLGSLSGRRPLSRAFSRCAEADR